MKNIYIRFLKSPLFFFYKLPKKAIEYTRKTSEIISLALAANNKTLYEAEKRKSKIIIFQELFSWLIKYGAVNDKYYFYGFDRKIFERHSSFLGYRQFKKLRDINNLYPNVEDKDSYNYVCILRDKILFSNVMSAFGLPVAKNLAVLNNEKAKWLNTSEVYSINDFFENDEILFDGFCKKIDGYLGEGAFKLKKDGRKIYISDKLINVDDLKDKLKGNYIIQDRIIQHKKMNDLYSHAVNCVRVITIRNHLKCIPFLAVVKMGANKSNVNNFGSGGIDVPVDLISGKLKKVGFANFNPPRQVDKHPNTSILFENYQIPFFRKVIDLAVMAHSNLYGVHSIGWDIAIAENGPILIEGNDGWGGSTEMYYKSNFKEEFLDLHTKRENSIFDNIYCK